MYCPEITLWQFQSKKKSSLFIQVFFFSCRHKGSRFYVFIKLYDTSFEKNRSEETACKKTKPKRFLYMHVKKSPYIYNPHKNNFPLNSLLTGLKRCFIFICFPLPVRTKKTSGVRQSAYELKPFSAIKPRLSHPGFIWHFTLFKRLRTSFQSS